ncbi:MAG: TolB family protein [Gammaproteobacteria bacterium]
MKVWPLRGLVAVGSLLLVGCGTGDALIPPPSLPTVPGTLVFVEKIDGKDQLFASDIDGRNRRRIVIGDIAVAPAHHVDPEWFNLTHEDQMGGMTAPRWSPDGERLILSTSRFPPEQGQTIVLDKDGSSARTASEQGAMGCTAWSPDLLKLACVKWNYGFTNVRLAVSDLSNDEISEIGPLPGNDGSFAFTWDATSSGIYYALYDQDLNESGIYYVDVQAKSVETIATGLTGQITSIAGDGDAVLITNVVMRPTGPAHQLVRSVLSTQQEVVVLTHSGYVYGGFLGSSDSMWVGRAIPGGTFQDDGAIFDYVTTGTGEIDYVPMAVPQRSSFDFHPE